MKTVRGVYQNGQLTLEEEISTDGPVEVVLVYEEKKAEDRKKKTLTFANYDVKLDNPSQKFSREELY